MKRYIHNWIFWSDTMGNYFHSDWVWVWQMNSGFGYHFKKIGRKISKKAFFLTPLVLLKIFLWKCIFFYALKFHGQFLNFSMVVKRGNFWSKFLLKELVSLKETSKYYQKPKKVIFFLNGQNFDELLIIPCILSS